MVRHLKHHEKKLLKKTDLYTYKSDQGHRAGEIQRRYGITDVEYNTYNGLCGSMRKLAHKLSQMDPEDPTRRKLESAMLEKLHSMGIIEKSREQGGALSQVEHLTVSAICRRRLPIVMVREQKMIQYVDKAIEAVAQGHVRVGTQVVQDPATLVTRNMVDFVQWVPNSNFKLAGQNYHGKRDDFDSLQL
ncbi:U3 small nucleolar ribonucleoprotein IMP3 [Penicillium cataractarum]|uniref:U3 small nucleolar ribonucleoprotein IMP3 n=1 Tax=Penicillium cataractarum TaxID=2100454 RepID=A0A9W9S3G2_9EURO|nr:U3 small nucleolar ribonucleoprotein IMP3 [Penicillium cataractarum]KAJ5368893.1 U3 small nucleolar ribonucleoprotein IMP3 [Penicillium cataractarum]